jgi:hypothetical protein
MALNMKAMVDSSLRFIFWIALLVEEAVASIYIASLD